MKEYIEREAVITKLNDIAVDLIKDNSIQCSLAAETVIDIRDNVIKKQPAADVVTVKHGAWLFDDGMDRYCSLCGSMALTSCFEYKQICTPYCPNCGAKMDGERKGGRDNEDR